MHTHMEFKLVHNLSEVEEIIFYLQNTHADTKHFVSAWIYYQNLWVSRFDK